MRTARAKLQLILIASFFLLGFPHQAAAQFLVDCSGNTPGAYTTINSVVPLLSNGSVVQILGTCNEYVTLSNLNNIWMGAPWGQTANLIGGLAIEESQNVFIYGMNVSESPTDGITVDFSQGVQLDSCSSTNNSGDNGLSIRDGSSVAIEDTGNYSNNGFAGIYVVNSYAEANGFNGPITVNGNHGSGVFAGGSIFDASNIVVTNTQIVPSQVPISGFGIDYRGGSRGQITSLPGSDTIEGNQGGGISLQENSEISLCCGPSVFPGAPPTIIQGNGPVGIAVGFGSQLTMFDGTQVTGHLDTGVDLFGKSQAYINGSANVISNNGTGIGYATRAGVRVDGNSEAYIRGGQIVQNGGPGILAIVNSSLDFTGVTITGNSSGPVECDISSWMVSDLATPGPHPGVSLCMTPNSFGNRTHPLPTFHVPDVSRYQAKEAKYKKLMSAMF